MKYRVQKNEREKDEKKKNRICNIEKIYTKQTKPNKSNSHTCIYIIKLIVQIFWNHNKHAIISIIFLYL